MLFLVSGMFHSQVHKDKASIIGQLTQFTYQSCISR